MDIKDLNKSQLILLAVLISFVTSLATGITTVTLMQQAPASITTPINRVVKQTIEKIQQVEGKTVTQTVVVKEEDLVVDAIAKNKSAVFSITKEAQDEDGKVVEVGAGQGFAVSNDGIVVADVKSAPDKEVYYLKNASGKFKVDFMSADQQGGFSFLKIGGPVDGASKAVYTVPTFGDLDKMKIGQKILILGNAISSFVFEGKDENENVNFFLTTKNAGSLVINLDGEALGMAVLNQQKSLIPIGTIIDSLKKLSYTASPKVL